MLSVDVNVLVYAFDEDSPRHAPAAALLAEVMAGTEVLLVFPSVAAGFLRVVTDRRILERPATPDQALAFLDALFMPENVRCSDGAVEVWAGFRELASLHQARGADVTDVLLAATAIRSGVTWYSFDRGFARFPHLNWANPADLA